VCTAAFVCAAVQLVLHPIPVLLQQVIWYAMALGTQLLYPILTLEMLDMHPQVRGAAASVQTFIALGVGALGMGVVAPLLHGDLRLLSWLSLGLTLSAVLVWRVGEALRRSTGNSSASR
jgi:hypothetical protein